MVSGPSARIRRAIFSASASVTTGQGRGARSAQAMIRMPAISNGIDNSWPIVAAEDQETELRVGLAKELARHAGDRVARPGTTPVTIPGRCRAPSRSAAKSNRNSRRPFAERFVELARMARHRAAIRENHCPRHVARPPVQFAVDEIGDAAEKQPDRDRLGNDVGKGKERYSAPPSKQDDRDRHAERAAMERHAAMPYEERLDRMIEIILGFIEQNVADAPAEHDAERRPHQEVVDIAPRDVMRRTPRRARDNSASRAAARRYRRARTSGSQRDRAKSRPDRSQGMGSQ